MNLANCKVVGYFSLPSLALAEHNPTAYSFAMADAPAGAGTCAHCGTGIHHHVVVQAEDGSRHFVGTSCAEKVGVPAELLRYRMTSDQKAARDARWVREADVRKAKEEEQAAKRAAAIERRKAVFGAVLDALNALGTEFHRSLASQLSEGSLSYRQAECVCKATSDTGRRNKKNSQAWENLLWLCQSSDEELEAAA